MAAAAAAQQQGQQGGLALAAALDAAAAGAGCAMGASLDCSALFGSPARTPLPASSLSQYNPMPGGDSPAGGGGEGGLHTALEGWVGGWAGCERLLRAPWASQTNLQAWQTGRVWLRLWRRLWLRMWPCCMRLPLAGRAQSNCVLLPRRRCESESAGNDIVANIITKGEGHEFEVRALVTIEA